MTTAATTKRRRKISEFQMADDLLGVIGNHLGRRSSRLTPEQRRDLNDRCLDLARHAARMVQPSEFPKP